MNKNLRRALIALGVGATVSCVVGFIGTVLHVPQAGSDASEAGGLVTLLTFCILATRISNRSTTFADTTTRTRALSLSSPPDKALLYFVRTGFVGKAMGIDILVDGKVVAQLQSPRFTCIELAPGVHQLTGQVGDGKSKMLPAPSQMPITLGAGTVTVLHVSFERGMRASTIVFKPWSLDATRSELAKLKMVAPQFSEG